MSFDEFAKKLHEDETLRKQFAGIDKLEDAYEMAKSNGLDISLEEFKEKMEEYIVSHASLSDEDVALVSGGDTDIASIISETIRGLVEGACGAI